MNDEDKFDEQSEPSKLRYKISSYGADYPVDSLVKRLNKDIIYLPQFQRHYVWTLTQASKFIESLLLGLPVPGIFLSKVKDSNKMEIIDGQQRLKTLQFFYEGLFKGKEFKLTGVTDQYDTATYKSLNPEDRQILDDSIIHITIIKQDEPRDDDSSIYYIFERLNTGGTLLRPQEIRACVYHGELNDLLSNLELNSDWQIIYGKPDDRLKSQETILRFFSFLFYFEKYEKPLKEFLNQYMGYNRYLKQQSAQDLTHCFENTTKLINASLGSSAFRPKGQIVASILDSVMVTVAHLLLSGKSVTPSLLKKSYDNLLSDSTYLVSVAKATSDETVVKTRFELAMDYLKGISK
jgi:hypothetical protein